MVKLQLETMERLKRETIRHLAIANDAFQSLFLDGQLQADERRAFVLGYMIRGAWQLPTEWRRLAKAHNCIKMCDVFVLTGINP